MKTLLFLILGLGSVTGLRAQTLAGEPWYLVSISDRENNMKQDIDSSYRIRVEMLTDSTYRGMACNGFRGSYRVSAPGAIKFSPPSGTKRLCQGPLGNVEKNLYRLLCRANSYALHKDRLVLYTDDRHELLFVRKK